MLTPLEIQSSPHFLTMSKRYSKAISTICGAAIFFLLLRTVNRAFNHEPLLRMGPLHGASLWKHVLETGETRWKTIATRMSPDPALPPPMDNTDGERVFHSGKYLAIYLGPPVQPVENRKGGGEAFQKFVQHLPRDTASEIPLTETYFDVGVRRDPYDKNMEDYQMAIRNTGEPHGLLIVRTLQRGRDPKLTASDCMFYAWREFATKLIGPGHSWRPINNLRYVVFDNIRLRETVEVIEMAYSKFNFGQKAISEPQIKVGDFRHWLFKPPREREMMLALLGTPNVASFARMLGDHFTEIGHKCIIGLATEQIQGQWMLGVLIGNEFGGECLDREVPDVVKGDRYIQEYKEEQARKEEEQALKDEERRKKKKNGKGRSKEQKPMGDKESNEEEAAEAKEAAMEDKRPKLEDFYKAEKPADEKGSAKGKDDSKEVPLKKGSSKKKDLTKGQDVLKEDSSKNENPANEDTATKKDSVMEDATTKNDAAKEVAAKEDASKEDTTTKKNAATDQDPDKEEVAPEKETPKTDSPKDKDPTPPENEAEPDPDADADDDDKDSADEDEKDLTHLPEETKEQRQAKLERAFKKQVDRKAESSTKGGAVIAA